MSGAGPLNKDMCCRFEPEDYEMDLFVPTTCFDLAELKCGICLGITRQPLNTNCGHLFCLDCLKRCKVNVIDNQDVTSCPTCRQKIIIGECRPNGFVKALIQRQQVKCRYWKNGCPARFVIGEDECYLLRHKNQECLYTIQESLSVCVTPTFKTLSAHPLDTSSEGGLKK